MKNKLVFSKGKLVFRRDKLGPAPSAGNEQIYDSAGQVPILDFQIPGLEVQILDVDVQI